MFVLVRADAPGAAQRAREIAQAVTLRVETPGSNPATARGLLGKQRPRNYPIDVPPFASLTNLRYQDWGTRMQLSFVRAVLIELSRPGPAAAMLVC